jgi:CopG family nickel-responsive transcriptional regulator
MEKLVRFGVAMPEGLLKNFDEWVSSSGIPNRSIALRHLVRDYISGEQWKQDEGTACGNILLMYDHHSNDITSSLTKLQHDYGELIICTTHVHVSHEICMECLIVKGDVRRIRELTEALSAVKGMRTVNSAISAMV